VRLFRGSLAEALSGAEPLAGFWGAPPREALEDACRRHGGARLFDLDVHHDAPRSGILPDAFCHIIRNCVDNAVALGDRLRVVVAATGPEKCDAGRFAARLVGEITGVPVMHTVNEAGAASPAAAPLLCEARGPLKRRVTRIMDAIAEPLDDREREVAAAARCAPTHGFWGTPPHPIGLLDLFPETTHVFGWTRCVELERPADLELELEVPGDLPTVFFSQGFCAKGMLARRLAERHRGMHVDVHDSLGAATMAKIEAFIRLSGGAR
jgi:hypothetical protein